MKFNPSLIPQASGSLGGTVFSRNRTAAYTRLRTNPVNPSSTNQGVQRSLLGSLAATWKSFNQANRDEWNEFAENYVLPNGVGSTYRPSGFQLYMTVNLNSFNIGGGPQNFPLAVAEGINLDTVTTVMDKSAGTFEITLGSVGTAGAGVKIFVTPVLSKGVFSGSVKNKFKQLRDATTGLPVVLAFGPTPVVTDIAADWIVTTGSVITGNVWDTTMRPWIKLVPVRSDFTEDAEIIIPIDIVP